MNRLRQPTGSSCRCFSQGFAKNSAALARNAPVSRRDDVNDAVSAPSELAQQGGEHPGSLRLGVVEKYDAATEALDSRQDQLQFLGRRHRQPVAGPDVGAEYHDVAGLQAVEQRTVRDKTGKAEERRGRIAAALPVSANSSSAMPRLISASALAGAMRASRGCENVWWPRLWPSASSRRAISGCASTLRPSKKNVA